MFRKVVWQHMQGVVGYLIIASLLEKKIENLLRFDRIMAMSSWPHFLAHPVGPNTWYM